METVPNGSFQGDVPGFSPDTERVRCEALGSLVQNSATANSAEAYLYSSPQKLMEKCVQNVTLHVVDDVSLFSRRPMFLSAECYAAKPMA